MVKEKFSLSSDIIRVENEPEDRLKKTSKRATDSPKDRMSLNIDRDLKKRLHIHCIQRSVQMTEIIEMCIQRYLNEGTEPKG